MTRNVIDEYGLQVDKKLGVRWLVQNTGPENFVGLDQSKSPFELGRKIKNSANWIDTSVKTDLESFPQQFLDIITEIKDKEIFNYFLPIPYKPFDKVIYIESSGPNDLMALNNLQQLSSPSRSCYTNIKYINREKLHLRDCLKDNNLCRYLVSGGTMETIPALKDLCSTSFEFAGRLIISGSKIPKYPFGDLMTFLEADKDLINLLSVVKDQSLFKRFGVRVLRQYLSVLE